MDEAMTREMEIRELLHAISNSLFADSPSCIGREAEVMIEFGRS